LHPTIHVLSPARITYVIRHDAGYDAWALLCIYSREGQRSACQYFDIIYCIAYIRVELVRSLLLGM